MANFCKVEDNIVTQVVAVPDSEEHRGNDYLNDLGLDGEWIQVSYNNRIRKVYPAIGFTYDRDSDFFVPPQPYPSWTWDEERWGWVAPVAMPTEDGRYDWSEETQSWLSI